jgi:phosphatidylinositol-bisphosphatase
MFVTPTYGMLIPGEQPGTVNVTITVDNHTAKLLNSGREVLEDTLVLRLENGRDYYITVKGLFARSCFAMSLDQLVLYEDPIRTVPLDAIERAEQFSNENEVSPSNALCVPKELWRLVDAMYEKGLPTPDLFMKNGIPEEVAKIREALDTGAAFGKFSIHSYVETFTSFLSSLSSPVIPTYVFPNTEINAENIQVMTRRLLEELPPIHYNVLVYIISFFREVLLYTEQNHLIAAKLAQICLKHCAPADVVMDSSMMQRRAGISLILTHLLVTNSI